MPKVGCLVVNTFFIESSVWYWGKKTMEHNQFCRVVFFLVIISVFEC